MKIGILREQFRKMARASERERERDESERERGRERGLPLAVSELGGP